MTIQDIQSLAEAHGLLLTDKMNFNEMGIDFKVVFALDTKGQQWLLRIPRRDGMREQIKKEKEDNQEVPSIRCNCLYYTLDHP